MLSKQAFLVFCVAFHIVLGSFDEHTTTIVHVPGVGDVLSRVTNDGIIEALNIPFAAPPVGENRFKPPQPAKYHDGTINATEYGNACMQNCMTGNVGSMSEDCLNLNIWAPRSQENKLLPVFFWIHGGGFLEGTGKLYNGSRLANLGLVVVTINYRLGAFGWYVSDEIATENPAAPGNGGVHGILDQVHALRWVREHIKAFGGDATQVTIGGESAGSLSTCTHLHLPASKGLFHRAIMESGACVAHSPWVIGFNTSAGEQASAVFAASVNATDLASLRKVAAETMLKSSAFITIKPVPDGWWLRKSPADLPVLGERLDIIVGANTMDTLQAPPYLGLLPMPDPTPKSVSAYHSLLKDYFGKDIFKVYPALPAEASPQQVASAFYGVSGDVCNTCPKHWISRKFLSAKEIVFVYEFGFSSGPFKGLACHGCEIPDAFGSWQSTGKVSEYMKTSYNPELAHAMTSYWASFIKTGVPSGEKAWEAYVGNVTTAKQLVISTSVEGKPELSLQMGIDAAKCEFFEQYVKASAANDEKYTNFCNTPVPLSYESADKVIVV